MTLKDYVILDPATNLVKLTTSCDDVDVANLYPNLTVVEAPDTAHGNRRVTPGMLYARGAFWMSIKQQPNAIGQGAISKLGFRLLFTNEELVRMDAFEADTTLTPENKAQLRTLMANVSAAAIINLSDPLIATGLEFIASIGYIAPDRKAMILSGATP
ncbi:MAG: hypothetical protein WCJ66_04505 [Verrucomicrobiota bacterium]